MKNTNPFKLTEREIQCILLIVIGHTDEKAAEHLALSSKSARFFIENAKKKLRAVNRVHLVAIAVSCGVIDLKYENDRLSVTSKFAILPEVNRETKSNDQPQPEAPRDVQSQQDPGSRVLAWYTQRK